MDRAARIVIDLVLVVIFAIIGRASHAEALDFEGVTRTALPFLGGTLLVWIFLILTNRRLHPLREGAVVWAATLVLGMVFRVLVGDGVQIAFVIVAAIFLALFLIGWRALRSAITRTRGGTRGADPKRDAARSGNPAVRDKGRKN